MTETLRGTTLNFRVYTDDRLSPTDATACSDAVLGACEADLVALSHLFGNIMPVDLPIEVHLTPDGAGASWTPPPAVTTTTLTCTISPGQPGEWVPPLVVAEVGEMLMKAQQPDSRGWGWVQSNGEGLSRILPIVLYPSSANRFKTAITWMNNGPNPTYSCPPGVGGSGKRPDYVSRNCGTDRDLVSIGCTTLFLCYLAYQLRYSWARIIHGTANLGATEFSTLEGIAKKLGVTPSPSGMAKTIFGDFIELLERHFPVATDVSTGFSERNCFPLLDPASWSDWDSIAFPPGVTLGRPALCAWAPDRLDAVAIGDDTNLWHLSWNRGWGSWERLAPPKGVKLYEPSRIVSREPNTLEALAFGDDGNLWRLPWASVGGVGKWDTWKAQPASGAAGSFDAVSWAPNRLDVVSPANVGLQQFSWKETVGSSTLIPMPGTRTFSVNPKMVSWGPNRLDVVAGSIDSSNELWHVSWTGIWGDGNWGDWEPITPLPTGVKVGQFAIASRSIDSLDVIASWHGHLWHTSYDGTSWAASWADLGAPASFGYPIQLCSWSEGRLDVFSEGSDGNVWHRPWDGTWGMWESLGKPVPATPFEMFVLNAANMRANQILLVVKTGNSWAWRQWS